MRSLLYVAFILCGGLLEFNATSEAGIVDCFSHILPDFCPSPALPTDLGFSPLTCAGDLCPSPLACADGWCSCCQDFANCSGHHGNLTYIPKLPKRVRFLDFSENAVRSGQLVPQFFTNATRVTHLSLAGIGFKGLTPGVFSLITNLTCLVLDHNDMSSTGSFRAAMSVPTLSQLSVVNTTLLTSDVRKLNASFVQVLDLSFNNITAIVWHAVDESERLKELNLNHCKLAYVAIYKPRRLQSVHLSHNNIGLGFVDFPKTCGFHPDESLLPHLEYLDLSYNHIKQLKGPICLPSLKFLELSHNKLVILGPNAFSIKSMILHLEFLDLSYNDIDQLEDHICLPSLKFLNLSYNRVNVLPPNAFSITKFPQLRTLVFNSRVRSFLLQSIDEAALNSSTLTDLSLADNQLDFSSKGHIRQRTFEFCPNVLNITVDGNDFLTVDVSRFLALFGKLGHLKTLSMRRCNIRQISSAMFSAFTHLLTLRLDDNNILSIPDGAFDSLHKLMHLHMSGNQVSIVSEDTFGKYIQHQLQVVDLRANPYLCTCDLLWFKRWLTSRPDIFYPHTATATTSYTCNNLPGTRVEDFAPNEQPCLLSREMSVQVIVSSSLLITSLTLISLLFRYRWHIRLVLYQAFRGHDDLRRHRLQADHFEFDVFVSFASEQFPWVLQHMKPRLEDEMRLRLCLHERDFIPGKNIVDNIMHCVESSKKILVLFSNDFVLSQWCQFELVLCLQHVLDVDDALIVICLDDVTSREMTSTMMAVLKTTTYIQWEDQEDAVESFWGRLRLGLQEIFQQANDV